MSILQKSKQTSLCKLDSQAIDLLRFPMAVLVVYGHMSPKTIAPCLSEYSFFSFQVILNTIQISISYIAAHTAIPMYFLISGFLFFTKLDTWNWATYWKKITSRIYSLAIPYLCWNLLAILIACLFSNGWEEIKTWGIRLLWDCRVWGSYKVGLLGFPLPSSSPFVVPLWFIRNLIVVDLFAPAFYFLFKNLKIVGVLALVAIFLLGFWPIIPGFGLDAFCYFGIGAYLSINKIELTTTIRKYRLPIYVWSLLTLCPCLYYGGYVTLTGFQLFSFWSLGGTAVMIDVAGALCNHWKVKIPKYLTESCFLIFALHTIKLGVHYSPLSYSIHLVSKAPLPTGLKELLVYFGAPIVTITFCLIIYIILKKLTPKTCSILTGNRS